MVLDVKSTVKLIRQKECNQLMKEGCKKNEYKG